MAFWCVSSRESHLFYCMVIFLKLGRSWIYSSSGPACVMYQHWNSRCGVTLQKFTCVLPFWKIVCNQTYSLSLKMDFMKLCVSCVCISSEQAHFYRTRIYWLERYAITDLSTRVGNSKNDVLAEILTFLDIYFVQVIMFVRLHHLWGGAWSPAKDSVAGTINHHKSMPAYFE